MGALFILTVLADGLWADEKNSKSGGAFLSGQKVIVADANSPHHLI